MRRTDQRGHHQMAERRADHGGEVVLRIEARAEEALDLAAEHVKREHVEEDMRRIGVLFFSTRGRHAICSRDWSSDVCSSDLLQLPLAEAAQGVQRLALAAAPFALQVDIEDSHGASIVRPCRSVSMRSPSFLNFSHTPLAAIREMSQPREPSRTPPRSTKVRSEE